jgi:ligand-binding sensor domain-containing protein
MFGRLVSNDVRALAVTHPVFDDVAHDVVWIATNAGLTRFDPAIPSFTTFTTAGSLALTEMQRVVAVSGGLLLATDKGMALYHGE